MDNGPFIDDFPLKMVTFHSYLKLPEGNPTKSPEISMKSHSITSKSPIIPNIPKLRAAHRRRPAFALQILPPQDGLQPPKTPFH